MRWTSEKEEYLKNNWLYQSDEELAQNIGTTSGAINTKRRRMQLIRKPKTIHNTKIYEYNEVKEVFKQKGYTLIDQTYVNYTTKMKYICNEHSEHGVQEINLCDLLRDRGCYYCGREHTINTKRFDKQHWVTECNNHNFTYVSHYYKDGYTYVRYICNKHKDKGVQEKEGYTLSKCPGCPYCKKTYYEGMIGDILSGWNIDYTPQKRFSGCKYKNTLPFDYFIDDYNIAIEYDGEFHYYPIKLGNKMSDKEAYDKLLEIQERDAIKTQYCKDNDIHLIRIPFWDQLYIEDLLFDGLVKYGALIEE